ncbi:class I poly(R)-hydroxyalkanoic acid synthase, partial [Photobacterium damselae]
MYQNFFSDYLVKLQETNQQWWHDFEANKAAVNSPLNKAMQEVNFEDTAKFFEQAANQPAAMLKVQTHWWEQQLQIWQNLVLSDPSKSVVEAELGDKRFANEAWQNELLYNFIKQSYLLFSKTYQDTIDSIE